MEVHHDARCPNCSEHVRDHPANNCVLNALIVCLRERDTHKRKHLRELHAFCDVDLLWGRVGPIIDALGDGEFTYKETTE